MRSAAFSPIMIQGALVLPEKLQLYINEKEIIDLSGINLILIKSIGLAQQAIVERKKR